jgi:hypothetical protein
MRHVITSVVLVLAVSAHARAQTPSEHLQLQRAAAMAGDVVVADDGGGYIRGKLVEATDAVLELETRNGRRRLHLSRVARVQQPGDTIIDGVLKGMGIATAWCALACRHHVNGDVHTGSYLGYVALGGLIGGAIDSRINSSRTVYPSRPAPGIHVGVGRPGVSVLVLF